MPGPGPSVRLRLEPAISTRDVAEGHTVVITPGTRIDVEIRPAQVLVLVDGYVVARMDGQPVGAMLAPVLGSPASP